MIEAADTGHGLVQRVFPRMAEGGMAEIVGERNGFNQIFVEAENARQRARDLRDLQAVGQSRAVVIAFVINEDLRLVDEPPERCGVYDAVAVALVHIPRGARSLLIEAAAALLRMRSVRGKFRHAFHPHQLTPVDNEARTSKLLSNVQERRTIAMTTDANISVSDRAANRIREIVAGAAGQNALRVSVQGGGCSGFRYDFELVAKTNEDDLIIEKSGARVAIDPVSVPYMAGSQIDYVDDLIGASFKITNPNATASCGCGTSFSV